YSIIRHRLLHSFPTRRSSDLIPFIAYHFVFNQIKNHEKEAILLWQLLGDLEAAYAILNYRTTLSVYIKPAFNEEKDVIGKTVYQDRKSTRLNSSHVSISYAVF